MSGRVALRVPAPARPQNPDATLCTPWFARDGAAVPGSAPALCTFDDSDFLERFLAGVAGGGFPLLKPLRDWAEPPRAMLDADGSSLLPATAVRSPIPDDAAEPEGAVVAEDVVRAEETVGWLRKLYLPTHRHFHLVAAELVCDRPDRPRLDPARVKACGAIVRRLRPGATEVWEDWVPTAEGKGLWAVLADVDMNAAGKPLDPDTLKLSPAADTSLRVRLGITDPKAPLPALSPVRLNPLPPPYGDGHTARFAFVPVQSRDVETPPFDAPKTAAALKAEALANLDERLVAPAAATQARVGAEWTALLDAGWPLWGGKPNPTTYAADRAAMQALVSVAWPDEAPALEAYDGPVARDALIAAVLRVATARVPGSAPAVLVPEATWDAVLPLWIDGLPGSADAHDDLKAAGSLPVVSAFASQLWLSILTDVAATALVVAPGSADQKRPYAALAAVLAWVRNARIQLEKLIRAGLLPLLGPADDVEPEERQVWDAHALGDRVPLFTVASASGEIEGYVAADELRADVPRPWPPMGFTSGSAVGQVALHRAAYALETALADFVRTGGAGGGGFDAAVTERADAVRTAFPDWRRGGLDLDAQPELGLLALDALHATTSATALRSSASAFYTAPASSDAVAAELDARKTVVLPRFDPDHVYCVQVYARVADRAGRDCVADRVVWSARTEPFSIADHLDMLGLKPAPMRMPDLPQLLRDLPRVARAGALPFAPITTPPDSGYVTGEDPEETARQWGIAWICSLGIPVFTICAWIVFSLIFSILIAIPGFAWMLLLKICIPVPVPRRS